ncbi:MAG: alpha/beta family hydrolase [Oleiphilaceae bacterium]|nr:alpha/beta family hydrolase [Oleiphilaceae bacterium]
MTITAENRLVTGPDGPLLVLAHGAGAPMDSGPMGELTEALNRAGIRVLRFEFPYMVKTRQDGRRRPPDRAPVLMDSWHQALELARGYLGAGERLFVGGKSMGGRMASHLLCGPGVAVDLAGGLCFGYPFHPPGKPGGWRTGHFPTLQRPLWIAQGERDPFGRRAEVSGLVELPDPVHIHWAHDADHDLVPAKRSGLTKRHLLDQVAAAANAFMANTLMGVSQ